MYNIISFKIAFSVSYPIIELTCIVLFFLFDIFVGSKSLHLACSWR